MYRILFSLFLRRLDAEDAHGLAFVVVRALGLPVVRRVARRVTGPGEGLGVHALGLDFPSPFGLAAGFDKDARGVRGLGALGFGHVEVGTVTARPQPGNDKPRLFRLLKDRALVNRMGFNNAGAGAASDRLRRRRRRRGTVVGVNIGKSRVVAVEDAVADYVRSAAALAPVADYLAVNVSSPNTPGLRGLQEIALLRPLLTAVRAEAGDTPLLVKIAPDLDDDQVRAVAELVLELGLDGIIATNTTIAREGLATAPHVVEAAGEGGLSGPPLRDRSLEVLRLLRGIVPEGLCLISVGGVETAEDVAERLEAGATLVQGYTAFIYRGPFWVRGINRGLRERRAG